MPELPLSSSRTLTDRMVALARVKVTDPISVVGSGALEMVVDLCRSGFEQVTCGCAWRLPRDGEHSDVLFVNGPSADDDLARRLGDASSLLGRQGVLVMPLADLDQNPKVVQALERSGLEVLSTVYDLSRETLVAHRVVRVEQMAMAA